MPLKYYQEGQTWRFMHKDTQKMLEFLLTMLAKNGEEKTMQYTNLMVLNSGESATISFRNLEFNPRKNLNILIEFLESAFSL